MEGLADDVLLCVFAYLDVKDLLRVRAMCRRWRSLALHQSLWRRLSIHDLVDGKKLCQAVLAVAPCLDRLSLHLDHPFPLLVTTKCAVEKLKFSVWDDRARLTMRVLRHQLKHGRLRELDVNLHGDYTRFAGLMQEICSAEGLLKLKMQSYRPPIGGEVSTTATPSTLRELYWDAPVVDRHLQSLLFSHRRTLQVVSVPYCVGLPIRIMHHLKALRRLECPPQDDWAVMAPCPALTALTIHMLPKFRVRVADVPRVLADVAGTAEFLSKATQLKTFKLILMESVPGRDLTGELLLAASSLRDSALEEVELVAGLAPLRSPAKALPSLAKALPHLSALRRISLNCFSLELLEAITPQNVPLLSELSLVLGYCAHHFIHLPEVMCLLSRNDRVHLLLTDSTECRFGRPCSYACQLRCHAALADPGRTSSVGVFSHPENEPCSVEVHCGRRSAYLWVQMSMQ